MRLTVAARATAAVFVLTAVAASGCIGMEQVKGAVPMAIYVTDAPADLTRLDVGISSVTVGDPPVPLDVQASLFDLAALRGPDDALLLASGMVPQGNTGSMEVSFAWAQATIGGETFDLELGAPLRLQDLSPQEGLLIDIGIPESLAEDNGVLRFEPAVKEVYALDPTATEELAWVSLGSPDDGLRASGTTTSGAGLEASAGDAARDGLSASEPDAGQVTDAVGSGPQAQVHLSDGHADASTAGEVVGWLATFRSDIDKADMRSMAEDAGGVFVFALDSLPVAYILATEMQMDRIAAQAGVVDVEQEQAVEFHDAESRMAMRMATLTDPLHGLRDANGDPIDGRGVGVAVVDTGIYAAHADILYRPLWPDGPVAVNMKVESQTFTDVPTSDTTSGHGTHVAGIIAGQGSSDPGRRGIAPGATLYGLGIGEASTTVWSAQAFDWILQNHDQVDPPIKVVTNSWSTGSSYNPGSVTNRLAAKMADEGLAVVFSAGNRGGDGTQNEVSGQCQIPKAGIICVAAYDDRGTGTRDGRIADYSSRGQINKPWTWPDVSAPGTNVLSTRPPVGSTTGFGTSLGYVELSGTSQAAPHVAGLAALMLQADPSLDGAEIEKQLKATTYQFTHGGAYTDGSHHAKGAGLVDAYAAVGSVM